jgi:outer membrane lipoprotein-sorting protein
VFVWGGREAAPRVPTFSGAERGRAARSKTWLFTALTIFASVSLQAAEPEALSAKDLAAKMSAAQEGTALVRLRMEVQGGKGAGTLQVQIKERRSRNSAEALYQIIFPKERKGEAVLLRSGAGKGTSGFIAGPGEKPRPLSTGQLGESVLGSDLSYVDLIENFFGWSQQTLAGEETIGRVNCVILESKPGKGDSSSYSRVKSWIDLRRLVPLRVEKYSGSGKLARRIETTKVANDDRGRPVPANLSVQGARSGSVTEVDGSRIKHDVNFSDRDFSPEAMAELKVQAE